MADPTIQTFCCHHGNGTDMAVKIMKEFNTDAYNTICIFSSLLGVFGAVYQLLPRYEFLSNHQWLLFSATRGRKIICYLALADLLASFGVLIRSTIWISFKNVMPLYGDDSSVLFCTISSAFIQYFYMATWIWTLCYAIDMKLILSDRNAKAFYYHLSAWLIPAVLTTVGLFLLYYPDANCHTSASVNQAIIHILPNYIFTYIPIATVMLVNPLLYHYSTKDMEKIITSTSGQMTSREREILDIIKLKFSVINFAFYIVWIPNFLNGLVIWTLWFNIPVSWIITIWYIMGTMNPLQALFNCLVYRRWRSGSEQIILPWKKFNIYEMNEHEPSIDVNSSIREELYPLLRNSQSINYNKKYSK